MLAKAAKLYSESVSFDRRLAQEDIEGSIAHAHALYAAGILSTPELEQIYNALREIGRQIEKGSFQWHESLEDVHTNIEVALIRMIGKAGQKLHTARSRNDQVSLDLRLYVKKEIVEVIQRLYAMQITLIDLASEYPVPMPGYTHLQRAQPITLRLYLNGQINAFARDGQRLNDCYKRVDVMPLGSGALAGSTIKVDRKKIADSLKFKQLSENSVDAVGDRDFVCEFLFCLAMIGMHLSRLSEDLIIWSTTEFGFIEFSDNFATGSSMMPQKKNPDMAELTRGKTGRLYGNLMAMLTVMKGLPMAYNRDLQEDKEALFDSVDTVKNALEVFAAMLPKLKVHTDRMKNAAKDVTLRATELAEYLASEGVPFRIAHKVVQRFMRRNTGAPG